MATLVNKLVVMFFKRDWEEIKESNMTKEATIKGYVGCDKDGTLRFCHHKPTRQNEIEQTWWGSCDADFDIWNHNLRELFKDLTWDDEPVEVELTLKRLDNKCADCNNVKGCITCTDGDQYAHITKV